MLLLINMQVRLRSGKFWVGILSILGLLVTRVLSIFGIEVEDHTVQEVMDIIMLFLILLAGFGVITDPTVKGISDSDLVMTKDAPTDPRSKVVYTVTDKEDLKGTDEEMYDYVRDHYVAPDEDVEEI